MRYIRTKDGRISDVEWFINEEKKNPYYTDYEFEEIKNEEDCCSIHWTAVGTKQNSIKDQIGRRCQFGITINSPFIKQSDNIEELCDEFVLCEDNHYCVVGDVEAKEMATTNYGTIYGAIWTNKGLIHVAKMNEKGELESL